jgi:hypothetical protein
MWNEAVKYYLKNNGYHNKAAEDIINSDNIKGKYNLAFDLWITKKPGKTNPPEENIVREIMIWLDYKNVQLPADWYKGKVTINGEVYKFYKAENFSTEKYRRTYLAFLKAKTENSGKTKIDEFIKYLVDSKHILPEEYLKNIDLGNEIWYGTGKTILNEYSIVIK